MTPHRIANKLALRLPLKGGVIRPKSLRNKSNLVPFSKNLQALAPPLRALRVKKIA